MGLLDALTSGSQGGYGGLLDLLMQKSPLLQQQAPVAGPQYDPTGMPFASPPQSDISPFGPLPQMSQPAMSRPPSVFNNGTSPVAGMYPAAPALPPAQTVVPPPEPSASQVNDINVGGYQMPRLGGVADFTPQSPQAMPTDVSAQSRQPQAEPQQSQALPPAFGGGSVLSRLGNPDGLIARLTGNDSRSVAQQMLKAKYDNYLANGLTHSQAMLAAVNPKASEVADQRILEKKKYGFTKLDNDTIVNQDPDTGKVGLAYGGEKQGDLVGPDGKKITIPEGLDAAGRKTFINEIAKINADAAAGKKTGEQATAEIYANKMELSNKTLDVHANQGTSLAGKIASGLPMGNYIQSAEYQKYKQASSNFITALLRKESGAAIGKQEFDRYEKEYMPQPGDGAEVLAQKTEARRVAIESMKKGAGPGYKSPTASPLPSGWSVSVR